MKASVSIIRNPSGTPDGSQRITLKLLNSGALPDWASSAANCESKAHCLLYLVPLTAPKIRSSQTRRLRLKDNLAGGKASCNAGLLARDPHFWDYLQQINLTAYDAEIDTRRARHFINRACVVSSRHDLDRDEAASQRFYNLIEQPFLDWLSASYAD